MHTLKSLTRKIDRICSSIISTFLITGVHSQSPDTAVIKKPSPLSSYHFFCWLWDDFIPSLLESTNFHLMQMKSFLSEHSAEYVLVPNLVSRLAPQFKHVIPLFYWATREGSSTAIQLMGGIRVRLLCAFARRPKIRPSCDDRVTVKLNSELLDYARLSAESGIAVLAGVPLVSSLAMFSLSSPCSWLEVPKKAGSTDLLIDLRLDGSVIDNKSSRSELPRQMSDAQIKEAANRCPLLSWGEAVQILRSLRSTQQSFRGFPYYGGYKPFLLILPTGP